ncbi:MAG: hypothetical protein KC492_03145, partial [Myxococcales bacterium]|nr:hypothetical protein [Myxococcales bacterium]
KRAAEYTEELMGFIRDKAARKTFRRRGVVVELLGPAEDTGVGRHETGQLGTNADVDRSEREISELLPPLDIDPNRSADPDEDIERDSLTGLEQADEADGVKG